MSDLLDRIRDIRSNVRPRPTFTLEPGRGETYRHPRKPKEDHLEIASTYTNYRRFEVKVEEQIALPQ